MADSRESQALAPGTVIGGCKLRQVQSSWGFYLLYTAEDAAGRPVLVQELLPEELVTRDASGTVQARVTAPPVAFAGARERYLAEGRVLMSIDHPGVQKVIEVFEALGTVYWVLAPDAQRTIKSWLQGLGRMPKEDELRRLLEPLLAALEKVHAAGLLHLNIKPETIQLTTTGEPILTHFAGARQAIARRGHDAAAVTAGYSPPEQYDLEKTTDVRADFYSLAAVLFRAMTGQVPPDAEARLVDQSGQRLTELLTGKYSLRFLEAINASLAISPADRPPNAAIWKRMIGFPKGGKGRRDTRMLWLAGAGAVALVFIAGVGWLLSPRPEPVPTPPPKKDELAQNDPKKDDEKKNEDPAQPDDPAGEQEKKLVEEQKKAERERLAAEEEAKRKAVERQQAEQKAQQAAQSSGLEKAAAKVEAKAAAVEQAGAEKIAAQKAAAKAAIDRQIAALRMAALREAAKNAEMDPAHPDTPSELKKRLKQTQNDADSAAQEQQTAERTAAQKATEQRAAERDRQAAAEERKAAADQQARETADRQKAEEERLAAEKEAAKKEEQNKPPASGAGSAPSGSSGGSGAGLSGTWETTNPASGRIVQLTIYRDGRYKLSGGGPRDDHGLFLGKAGSIQMRSDTTGQVVSSSFVYRGLGTMKTAGALGDHEWKRVDTSQAQDPDRPKDAP